MVAPLAIDERPKTTNVVPVLRSNAEALTAAAALARAWAQTAAQIDAERRIPYEEMRLLSRSGLLAITVPREHGGPGLSTETLINVFRVLAAADLALAQIAQNHFDFVDALVQATPATQKIFYPQVLNGARFGNAIAERGRRSRADLSTTIVEDGDGYRLNGEKYFCTGALTADWVPVLAMHADGRIRTAYVARDAAGLEVRADWDAFGQRATFSGTTILRDVRVPRDHVVDRSLGHAGVLAAQFSGNQLIHAALEVGAAEGAIRQAAAWLADEGRNADPQLIGRLGELDVEARAAKALVVRAARLVDQALEAPEPLEKAPIAAAIAVDEAKSLAYTLGPKVTGELPVFASRFAEGDHDRHWRNARTHSLHDPVRWRQHFVGDYHLNGRLSADLLARLKLAAQNRSA